MGTETTRITFPDVIADANRRKTLAQASQIRLGFLDFLDPYLTDGATRDTPLVVRGDINDGPGLDASEKGSLGAASSGSWGRSENPNCAAETPCSTP